MPLLADGLHNLRHALRSWAVLIHWLPTASSMSSLHLLLGLPLSRFPSLGVHSDVIFAHLVFFILATCPAHCPFMHFTFSIISITERQRVLRISGFPKFTFAATMYGVWKIRTDWRSWRMQPGLSGTSSACLSLIKLTYSIDWLCSRFPTWTIKPMVVSAKEMDGGN